MYGKEAFCKNDRDLSGFPIVGGGHGGVPPPILQFFLKTPSIKTDAPPWSTPTPLKNKAPHLKNNPSPPLKSETPFQEMIPRKKTQKNQKLINTCVSIIKQHWRKMVEM